MEGKTNENNEINSLSKRVDDTIRLPQPRVDGNVLFSILFHSLFLSLRFEIQLDDKKEMDLQVFLL